MSEILLRAHRRLEPDGINGLRVWVLDRWFDSVTQAIAAAIRDQATGWYRCQEVIRAGTVLFGVGTAATDWARAWDEAH